MQELAPGVYDLALTFERDGHELTIHPAAVETDRGVVLLDVGFPGQADDVDDHLAEAGLGLDDVSTVLLTHQDGDHAAGLSALLERTDATVVAHREAAPYVDGRRDPIKGEGDRYPPVPVDVQLVDGVVYRTRAGEMSVVFTPGHAPGHVSLYFPDEGLLVAADALTARDGLTPPSEEFTLDVPEAAASVLRLADLDVAGVLCYHGGFVEADDGRIREIGESLDG